MLNKRIVKPDVTATKDHQLYSTSMFNLAHDPSNRIIGSLFMVTKFQNMLPENLWILNEFNEREMLPRSKELGHGLLKIDFSHSKSPLATDDKLKTEAYTISFTHEDFRKNKGMIYVKNLNIVMVLESVMRQVDVQHPYPVPSYDIIIQKMAEQLASEISSFGFCWWVNEPEPSNRNYYLDFYGNIILLAKSHCEGGLKLTFIAPKNNCGVSSINDYPTAIYGLQDLKHGDVKDFTFTAQNEEYRFYISDSFEALKVAQKKRVKDPHTILSVEDHEHAMKILRLTKDQELDELKASLTKKMNEMEAVFKKRLEKLEFENENLHNFNAQISNFAKFTKDARVQEAEENKAKTAEQKEKIALWGNIIKYGATVLLTLASVAAAKKAVKS